MTILGRSEELVSRCVECDLAEPESLSSLGGSAPGVVDGILSDITNPVRELSKSMDGASMAQVTEMYRVINFVLETKTLGLRMVPIFNDGVWKLEALSDSDFANDKDTRYSVYGYIIFLWCSSGVEE